MMPGCWMNKQGQHSTRYHLHFGKRKSEHHILKGRGTESSIHSVINEDF